MVTNIAEKSTTEGAGVEKAEGGKEIKLSPEARIEAMRAEALGGTKRARDGAVRSVEGKLAGVGSVRGSAEDRVAIEQRVAPGLQKIEEVVTETEKQIEGVASGDKAVSTAEVATSERTDGKAEAPKYQVSPKLVEKLALIVHGGTMDGGALPESPDEIRALAQNIPYDMSDFDRAGMIKFLDNLASNPEVRQQYGKQILETLPPQRALTSLTWNHLYEAYGNGQGAIPDPESTEGKEAMRKFQEDKAHVKAVIDGTYPFNRTSYSRSGSDNRAMNLKMLGDTQTVEAITELRDDVIEQLVQRQDTYNLGQNMDKILALSVNPDTMSDKLKTIYPRVLELLSTRQRLTPDEQSAISGAKARLESKS